MGFKTLDLVVVELILGPQTRCSTGVMKPHGWMVINRYSGARELDVPGCCGRWDLFLCNRRRTQMVHHWILLAAAKTFVNTFCAMAMKWWRTVAPIGRWPIPLVKNPWCRWMLALVRGCADSCRLSAGARIGKQLWLRHSGRPRLAAALEVTIGSQTPTQWRQLHFENHVLLMSGNWLKVQQELHQLAAPKMRWGRQTNSDAFDASKR